MRLAIVVTAFTSLCLSTTAPAQTKPPEGAVGGKIIFDKICAPCHGKDARGGGPVAESLKTQPPDLTRIAARRNGDFRTVEITSLVDGRESVAAHGPREMPVWGDGLATEVTDEKVRRARTVRAIGMVVEYLQSIQK